MVGLGVDDVTPGITTERLDTVASSIVRLAAATAAQPVIAEQVVGENGEWHGVPDRASFEA